MPYTKTLIWLIEKAVECGLGGLLLMIYFAFDSRLASGPAVQELFGDYFQTYRALVMTFYGTMGYGLTSGVLNLLLYRRQTPISMPRRIGLNLAVFSLSFGAGIALLVMVTYDEAIIPKPSRDTGLIYQLGLILYPISLAIVAFTSFAGQKVRERFAPQTLTAPPSITRQ